MPKKFPPEFKRDVVVVARRADTTLTETAADFDISTSTLKRWMAQADIDDGIRHGHTSAELGELVQLRRRNRRLEQEVEICGGRRRTSRRTQPQNDVPAGP